MRRPYRSAFEGGPARFRLSAGVGAQGAAGIGPVGSSGDGRGGASGQESGMVHIDNAAACRSGLAIALITVTIGCGAARLGG